MADLMPFFLAVTASDNIGLGLIHLVVVVVVLGPGLVKGHLASVFGARLREIAGHIE